MMHPHALQQEFCKRILDTVTPDPKIFGHDAEARVGIYRNAYRARLMSCLRNNYEKTWSWIGDDAFDTAARQHCILNPPQSWTLDDYGTGFNETLGSLFQDDPEVAELALLEWAMQNAFGAVDEAVIDVVTVQAFVAAHDGLDHMRMTVVQSLFIFPIRTNCAAIWQDIADDNTPPPPSLLEVPAYLRIWRKSFSPHFRTIDTDEVYALNALAQGESFGDICSYFTATSDAETAIVKAGTMLGHWLGDELISALV